MSQRTNNLYAPTGSTGGVPQRMSPENNNRNYSIGQYKNVNPAATSTYQNAQYNVNRGVSGFTTNQPQNTNVSGQKHIISSPQQQRYVSPSNYQHKHMQYRQPQGQFVARNNSVLGKQQPVVVRQQPVAVRQEQVAPVRQTQINPMKTSQTQHVYHRQQPPRVGAQQQVSTTNQMCNPCLWALLGLLGVLAIVLGLLFGLGEIGGSHSAASLSAGWNPEQYSVIKETTTVRNAASGAINTSVNPPASSTTGSATGTTGTQNIANGSGAKSPSESTNSPADSTTGSTENLNTAAGTSTNNPAGPATGTTNNPVAGTPDTTSTNSGTVNQNSANGQVGPSSNHNLHRIFA